MKSRAKHFEDAIRKAIKASEEGKASDAIQDMLDILEVALETAPTETSR